MATTEDTNERLGGLIASMANLPLFVALRETVDAARLDSALVLEHLRWMVEQEAAGSIFASGPFVADDQPRGAAGGLTIVRAGDERQARRLLDSDPFVRSGAVRYELRRWVLMEGALDIRVRLSGRQATLV